MIRRMLAILLTTCALSPSLADPGEPLNGWRGNGTGLFPDARPPIEWSRIPRGGAAEIRARAERPADKAELDSPPLAKGIVRDWLVIGPFPVNDSVKDFNQAQIADEAKLEPTSGDIVGELSWKKMSADIDDPFAFGPANAPWADVAEAIGGYKNNQISYAHSYLYSPKGGTVRAVLEHGHGLKAWLNGKELYCATAREGGMGNYYAFSRVELGTWELNTSPRFDLELKAGWNRLLLKVGAYNKDGWKDQHFCLRLMDLPDVAYDSKNILWTTELPQRSNATPIIAGDRLFVMAEPDELLCLDKHTGKILWTAANNYYEALTPDERRAKPGLEDKVDPLIAELKKETDFIKRQRLRTRIQKLLVEIDPKVFAWKTNEHYEAHFGIVGFTTPTPVCDGKNVWVWCGNGVAACYELDGKRKWITRLEAKELSYSCSPALADGTLAVFQQKLIGLDAATGKVRWEQPKINSCNGSVLAARIAKVPVFVNHAGHVVRARDGAILFQEENDAGAGACWCAPLILGDVIYRPRYGVTQLEVTDFSDVSGDSWKPDGDTVRATVGRLPNGKTADRMTAGSPLVLDGLGYMIDIYGTLYVLDLKAKKMVYSKDTGLRGLFHYNSLPVAASPTLMGKHIVVQDNQGTALVLQPGREYKEVARNHLATVIDRYWPIPAQETIGYSPPILDGDRIYIRGERFIYCVGEK